MSYFRYSGEIDAEGRACGYGVAVFQDDPNVKYKGTWLDDKYHGIGILSHNANKREEAEFRNNFVYGKGTQYIKSSGNKEIKNFTNQFLAETKYKKVDKR